MNNGVVSLIVFTRPQYALGINYYSARFCAGATSLMRGWLRFIQTEWTHVTDVTLDQLIICTFWSCPKLFEFWRLIFDTFETVLFHTVNPDPLVALFGLPPTLGWSRSSQHVIAFTTLLARRLILLKWTHVAPPTHNTWIQEILRCLKLEKIRFSLSGSLQAFYKIWQIFLLHIDSLHIEAEMQ